MISAAPLSALAANIFSTLFARQLVVPTFAESATIDVSGVVSVLPVSTLSSDAVLDRPFTMGHGPVVVSTTDSPWTTGPDPAMVSVTSTLDRGWTTAHGPAIVPKPTSTIRLSETATLAATPTASALSTVIKRSPAALNTSTIARRYYHDHVHDNCHKDNNDWIYFTLLLPNDTIVLGPEGDRVLFYVSKEWHLTYPEMVRKTLFNDPAPYPSCPEGHCRSTIVPGTGLRLELVKRPKVFRAGWNEGNCGYVDDAQTTRKNLVTRGRFGYLKTGAMLNEHVVAFVEQQLLATYPTLEVGLIFGFTVGLFVVLPLAVVLGAHSYRLVMKTAKVCGTPFGQKSEDTGSSSQVSDSFPLQGRGNAASPPAYTYV